MIKDGSEGRLGMESAVSSEPVRAVKRRVDEQAQFFAEHGEGDEEQYRAARYAGYYNDYKSRGPGVTVVVAMPSTDDRRGLVPKEILDASKTIGVLSEDRDVVLIRLPNGRFYVNEDGEMCLKTGIPDNLHTKAWAGLFLTAFGDDGELWVSPDKSMVKVIDQRVLEEELPPIG